MDETLGEKVARLRCNLGLGQKELGRAVGRSESWVSNIEKGKIADLKAPQALLLAERLGTTVEFLTGAPDREDGMAPVDPVAALLPSARAFIAAMPRAALVAASQMPGMADLTDPYEVAAMVAYVEAKPDPRFRDFLAARRAALPAPAYVRGAIRIYTAWSSNADLLLEGLEILFPDGDGTNSLSE